MTPPPPQKRANLAQKMEPDLRENKESINVFIVFCHVGFYELSILWFRGLDQ